MPEIPEHVDTLYGSYSVQEIDLGTQESMTMDGETNHRHRTVSITTRDSTLEVRWQVFFHELLHLAEHHMGMKLKDDPDDSDIDRLATALYDLFLRNKWKLPGQ
jgi:hypothetical protein